MPLTKKHRGSVELHQIRVHSVLTLCPPSSAFPHAPYIKTAILYFSLVMGSACCTAARSRDHSCPTDGWSLDQSGHGCLRRTPSVLVHQRWPRRSYVYEASLDETCTFPPHRSSFSSSRSYSSFGGMTVSSQHQHESMDGVLGVFSSPTESLYHSVNEMSDPTIMHSDSSEGQLLQKSGAHLNQESGKTPAVGLFSTTSRWGSSLSGFNNLGKSVEAPVSYTSNDFWSTELELHRQRIRYSIDGLPSSAREKTDSWKAYMFPELGSLSLRLSNVDTCQEDVLETCIGQSGTIDHHERHSTSYSEGHKCGLCTKGISKKSPWSLSRLPGSKELPVVGILDCGHVYHADCLDRATPIMHAHDPPCPNCGSGKIKINEDVMVWEVNGSNEEFMNRQSTGNSHKSSEKYSSPLIKAKTFASTQKPEKSFSATTLLRKQFALRGKLTKDTYSGAKRPGYPTRVSPENGSKVVDRDKKVPMHLYNCVQ